MQAGAGAESAPTYLHHFTSAPRESFLWANNEEGRKAVWFLSCPRHVLHTGRAADSEQTPLPLTHLDLVLVSTKPLAATQMELTEYSPYF